MEELKDLYIIIAEDDMDDGDFVQQSFNRHPAFTQVDWVKNGKELLDILKDADRKKPDVILTDINMPIVNGIEVLEHMFHDPLLCTIPAFVYSSTVNPVYEVRCRELGIKAFLIKPFNLSHYDDIPYQIVYILNQQLTK
jgi:CheY-like chemotaxis protein